MSDFETPEERLRAAKQANQRAAHAAQKDPTSRRKANLAVLFIVVPSLLVAIGALAWFFVQHPNGLPR